MYDYEETVEEEGEKQYRPFQMFPNTIHHNPSLDPPEAKHRNPARVSLKKQWSLALQGSAWKTPLPYCSTSSVSLGKLLFTHQNPTRQSPSPRIPSLSDIRESKSHHSTSEPSPLLIYTLTTQLLSTYHRPSTIQKELEIKQWVTWTISSWSTNKDK